MHAHNKYIDIYTIYLFGKLKRGIVQLKHNENVFFSYYFYICRTYCMWRIVWNIKRVVSNIDIYALIDNTRIKIHNLYVNWTNVNCYKSICAHTFNWLCITDTNNKYSNKKKFSRVLTKCQSTTFMRFCFIVFLFEWKTKAEF